MLKYTIVSQKQLREYRGKVDFVSALPDKTTRVCSYCMKDKFQNGACSGCGGPQKEAYTLEGAYNGYMVLSYPEVID